MVILDMVSQTMQNAQTVVCQIWKDRNAAFIILSAELIAAVTSTKDLYK